MTTTNRSTLDHQTTIASPHSRRFFAAKSEVAEAFIQMASRKGLTLYGAVNDLLTKAVELDTIGVSIEEALKGFSVFRKSREVGMISVPEDLWYQTSEISLGSDQKGTIARFANCGEWIGRYIQAKSRPDEIIQNLAKYLSPFTSSENEFSLEGDENVRLRWVNPRQTQLYTEAFSALLSKAVEATGYATESRSLSRGMILLSFHKSRPSPQKIRREILA